MISVVIPAYNEEKEIKNCLDSFVKQTATKTYEVILVNNNSTDKTTTIAEGYFGKLNLKIFFEKEKGRGAARNKGFMEASGNIILSTDADTKVPPNWIEELSNKLLESRAVAVSGTCKIFDCGRFDNAAFNFLQPLVMKLYRVIIGHYWLSGFNFAIYKKIYESSGGFNPKLNALEDIELSFRVSRVGKILFAPDLPVIFSGRRFHNGLIYGTVSYMLAFIGCFFFKKENAVMSDIR